VGFKLHLRNAGHRDPQIFVLTFALSAFVAFQTPVCAQTIAPAELAISTDRPSIANSSAVVPRGIFQVENGFLITDTQSHYVLDLPETALRFGLFEKTELRFSVPDYFHSVSTGFAISGFGDMAIGVKQQISPLPENFNLSVIVFLSLPTGANAISSHGYNPGLQLPWSRPLSQNWTLSGQVAFYWPTQAGARDFTGETTFVLDRQLTKPWDVFVEYAADFPENGGSRQLLHIGSAYKLAPGIRSTSNSPPDCRGRRRTVSLEWATPFTCARPTDAASPKFEPLQPQLASALGKRVWKSSRPTHSGVTVIRTIEVTSVRNCFSQPSASAASK
jgi:hypothetical protein